MLQLQNISVDVPNVREILRGISLTVEKGRLVVLTGPNGGGKSTLAKVIAGIQPVSSGSILFDGEDITGLDITARARRGIAFAFQQPVRFKGISVRELLSLSAGETLSESRLCSLLRDVGLCARDYIDREVDASLSGGEIKRIEIASALSRRAKLTIFDEPEAGIDLWSFQNLIGVFERLRGHMEGTMMIISHQERILAVADEIAVLNDGRITAYGPREQILPSLLSGGEKCAYCPGQEDGCIDREGASA
ncbi:MAG: ATP-binding cassette domain-containing protein [Provencibacterium sp.]|nr:ATP-binding cassette domain-containing protein [Provencibacterium sp.]